MSVFLFGNYASSAASQSLGAASLEASNSAARLASGIRSVSGKAGGTEIGWANVQEAESKEFFAKGVAAQYESGQAQQASAILEALSALYIRAEELGQLKIASAGLAASADYAAELTQLLLGATSLVSAATSMTLSQAASLVGAAALTDIPAATFTAELAIIETARAKLGGVAAGKDYEAVGNAAIANSMIDAAQNTIAVDFGVESANLARNQVMQQAAAAMLAQANQMPSVILALFK